MPSSYVDSVPTIIKLMVEENPTSICDIGPGWGKYGLMAREYLPGLERLDAVEVWQGRARSPVISELQDVVYDDVFIADARHINSTFWSQYELVLLIDVIEHMAKAEGTELLERLTGAGCDVIVSTPKQWFEQHDELNPHESHVSFWTWQDFPPPRRDASTVDSLIFQIPRARKFSPPSDLRLFEPTDGEALEAPSVVQV